MRNRSMFGVLGALSAMLLVSTAAQAVPVGGADDNYRCDCTRGEGNCEVGGAAPNRSCSKGPGPSGCTGICVGSKIEPTPPPQRFQGKADSAINPKGTAGVYVPAASAPISKNKPQVKAGAGVAPKN